MIVDIKAAEPMGFWTFLSIVIPEIVWPIFAAYLLYYLKKHNKAIAEIIENIRFKDFELTLRKRNFDEARDVADTVKTEIENNNMPIPQSNKTELLNQRTDVAILDIWKRLERELINLHARRGIDKRILTPQQMLKELVKSGNLSENDFQFFEKLRKIRNEAVHTSDMRQVTMAELIEFDDFIDILIRRLNQIL